ncbi:MAG: sugar-binding domain-containing protein [Pirellulales bacterium]
MLRTALALTFFLCSSQLSFAADWQPKQAPLMTRWAKDVTPEKVHPEYPRPQMVRKDWQNLNGLWDYAIRPKDPGAPGQPQDWDGKILVPFPVESALSGVMKQVGPENRLWYRKSFTVPEKWKGQRVLLHFGGVDWDTIVLVNGKKAGDHRGGYDPFTFDITDALKNDAENEIVVSVWDPSDAGFQPRGKQVRKPHSIWYTPTTGIWQTVWLEPVHHDSIADFTLVPDIDQQELRVTVHTRGRVDSVEVVALVGAKQVARSTGKPDQEIVLKISNPQLWSPDSPYLYSLRIVTRGAKDAFDSVGSHFAMRKISLGKDDQGINRLMLNGKFLFQYGPLDQGFWPDGLYTAPTDEALKYDLEVTKRLGFNMVRKHVKVEPARWYYHCDKLGLLVWQDMPSGDRYIRNDQPDITRSAESAKQFETEWANIIKANYNSPSIILWVPFNEGWGQFDTARITDLTKRLDPTRLVISASGWTDRATGDVHDIHVYPGPGSPKPTEKRAAVLGEFGGLGLPLEGHTWQAKGNWGYRSYTDRKTLIREYVNLLERLHPLIGDPGLSAAVYTQTTDVEIEVNGLMTYDREVIKLDDKAVIEAAHNLHLPPPKVTVIAPTSQEKGLTWSYTLEKPSDGWEQPKFDGSSWKEGPGGFGTRGTPGAAVRTEWETNDIWLRREFEIKSADLGKPQLVIHHDEDAEVYLNGVLAARLRGYVIDYTRVPVSDEARAALREGKNTMAVHCRQTGGGQYIDAGLVNITPLKW